MALKMIKKAILELWCMAYGAMLFLIAWWFAISAISVIAVLAYGVYLLSPHKSKRPNIDET